MVRRLSVWAVSRSYIASPGSVLRRICIERVSTRSPSRQFVPVNPRCGGFPKCLTAGSSPVRCPMLSFISRSTIDGTLTIGSRRTSSRKELIRPEDGSTHC
uniref:Uncharacterized protein n=1 Tax=Cacopsylla melanoneura TaxID=428564 RepID=A0A8D8TRC3_9HEMI